MTRPAPAELVADLRLAAEGPGPRALLGRAADALEAAERTAERLRAELADTAQALAAFTGARRTIEGCPGLLTVAVVRSPSGGTAVEVVAHFERERRGMRHEVSALDLDLRPLETTWAEVVRSVPDRLGGGR